ncbi:hypothetical protein CkaCkLH20_06221 [Colletotrichum karsti]|uniref:Uncharacterized protein n=1 Tax=Colletotrichum karsti TaxID=1095194 RepID=A0A9P6I2U2_9PEZI|nr:uncharacterized protein CkaCkLH20_06221 [Colletotrichum karsti]KAF9876278.1 hypothetical protein CkaCkLH20_06221 [Colletotrichum karsti]
MAAVAILPRRPLKRVLEADPPPYPSLASPLDLMILPTSSVDFGLQASHLNSPKSPNVQVTPVEPSGPPVRRRRLSSRSSNKSRVSAPSVSSISDIPDSASSVFTPEIPQSYRGGQVFANPFEDHFELEHKGQFRRLEGKNYPVVSGAINGYVKIPSRWRAANLRLTESNGGDPATSRERESMLKWLQFSSIPQPWYDGLDDVDRGLFDFYVSAWCTGRTVLRKTNTWLRDIAPMVHQDGAVKHAVLALAGTYVYDYHHTERIRQAAELHYRKAVINLSLSLTNARQQTPSDAEADALVAAIAVLNMNDVVSSEHWRGKDERPRWLDGAHLACQILDMTDPGYRYQDAKNIQPSEARMGNAIIASRTAILALPMVPLDRKNTQDKQFVWLLQGPEQNITRIHGGCGMSPLLLYHFSQITHITSLVSEDPVDTEFWAVPMALRMLDELKNVRQWYEYEHKRYGEFNDVTKVSINVDTIRDQLRSRFLDAHGAIKNKEGMTASTAEAWRLAAVIYLLCRLLRLPRDHPEVLLQASKLAATIRVMPTSGCMFTAQAPFFPVFLLGIVAVEKDHCECAMEWFEAVIETKCRSSVPPAYDALVEIRQWMSTNIKDAPQPIPDRIRDRYAWWEDVVDHVAQTLTTLCLV